ncbi:mechanosensitive ion channel family protein [Micrococcus endophyticus]|uniref:mechanosensitive ion channel family protein n=1 Tax=Micrococcus endophyticus TaxID=455343 RepID=UPI00200460E8|nr:mechanosensitive ion channel domain-containing protein [Micrococcus endophyticus]
MVFPALPALATPPLLTALDRLLAGETVPTGVEGDIQDGAAATTRAFGVEWGTLLTVLMAFAIGAAVVYLALQVARVVLVRRPAFQHGAARLSLPAAVAAGLLASRIWLGVMAEEQTWYRPASFLMLIAVAAAGAWAAWRLVGVIEAGILGRYQETGVEHRRERRIRTQTILIRRILNAVIVVVAVAVVLLGVPEVRSLGAGLLASAGVISVIAGLAVQSTLTNVFAGFQLAFTDAIRVGDVVDMEGVFGTVEEITLSNVVLKLWDGRRMVYPSSHFTTQPFENWTRVGTEVSGVVELDVDWRVPMPALRERLTQLLDSTDLWDGRESSMQVTDAIGGTVRIRAVVSARNSGDLWDLRCLVREDLVTFLRSEHPEGIVVQRMVERHPAHDDAAPASEGSDAGARGGDPTGEPGPAGTGAGGEPRPRTAALPRVEGGEPRPDTVTTPLTRVDDHAGLYTGSITAVQRNRELHGPGEDAFAERRAQQAKQARDAERSGSHAAEPGQGRAAREGSATAEARSAEEADRTDDAVTRRRQDDED